ncbi:MAG: hypothetical protein K0U37_09755 [Gammaproteobacteria bacterium]|nr:hypothetical protein [Gammaproteobacteria bacterium]
MVNIAAITTDEFNQKFKEASTKENNEVLIQDTMALLNDANHLSDRAEFSRRGSLIANGLQTMLDKKT